MTCEGKVLSIRATLEDVAKHAGVSASTASLVMRGSSLVAEMTRRRVLQSAEVVGYVYNRSAANLRTRTSHTIGLIVCDITNPFYAEFTAGAESVLEGGGKATFLCNASECVRRQEFFLSRMSEQNVDGIILSPAEGSTPESLRRLDRAGVPFVQAIRYLPDLENDFVGVDSRLGMRMAVDHLVRLGHRRIAFIGGGSNTSSTRDRQGGFVDAMRGNGMAAEPRMVVSTEISRAAGRLAIRQILAEPEPPTAAICYADVIALGVLWELEAMGIRAGERFAVIGHDNIEESGWVRPALTTISISPRQLGEEAARLMLRRLDDPGMPVARVILPPRLIVRMSCGPDVEERDETLGAA